MGEKVGIDDMIEAKVAFNPTHTESVFTVEQLQENCQLLFNVDPYVFVGAMAGRQGLFTKRQVETIIRKWLSKEVE